MRVRCPHCGESFEARAFAREAVDTSDEHWRRLKAWKMRKLVFGVLALASAVVVVATAESDAQPLAIVAVGCCLLVVALCELQIWLNSSSTR